MAISKQLRFAVLERDGFACQYCGRIAPEVKIQPSHILPVIMGGGDGADNLVAACEDCEDGRSSTHLGGVEVGQVSPEMVKIATLYREVVEAKRVDLKDQNDYVELFEAFWKSCSLDRPILRPDNWRNTIKRFHGWDIPLEFLLEATEIAMDRKEVRPSHKFKYMCGVVNTMNKQLAHAALAEASQS